MESKLVGVTFVNGESDFLQEARLTINPNPKILFDKMFLIFRILYKTKINIKTIDLF